MVDEILEMGKYRKSLMALKALRWELEMILGRK
jgi:hypothetical protein